MKYFKSVNPTSYVLQDVLEFGNSLPNIRRSPYLIPLDKFSHLDFFLAVDVKSLLYDQILKDMEDDETPSRK